MHRTCLRFLAILSMLIPPCPDETRFILVNARKSFLLLLRHGSSYTKAFALLMIFMAAGARAFSAPQQQYVQEVTLSKEALSQGLLIVPVQLENGEELPFLVDTGSPITLFDKSLKDHLGKRLQKAKVSMWGKQSRGGFYPAPRMFIGDMRLDTGTNVVLYDLEKHSREAGQKVAGLLGMDCLVNHCFQIDFEAGRMRFLNASQLQRDDVGKRFAIHLSNVGQGQTSFVRTFIQHDSLFGENNTNIMIDTGLSVDGACAPAVLEIVARNEERVQKEEDQKWYFPEREWNGQKYTNLVVLEATSAVIPSGSSIIGLRFLARHLVTFDFPNKAMYLLPQRSEPLSSESLDLMTSLLMLDGKLPVDIENQVNRIAALRPPPRWFRWLGGTLNISKVGEPTRAHYTLRRKRKGEPWRLKKAWRTDRQGRTIQEYKSF